MRLKGIDEPRSNAKKNGDLMNRPETGVVWTMRRTET